MLRIDQRRGCEVWLRWSAAGQSLDLFSADTGVEADYIGSADTLCEARLFAADWLTAEVGI